MPAHEHLHNYQFEMFMPARKLFNEIESEDTSTSTTLSNDPSIASEKLDESQMGGAHDSRMDTRSSKDENWDHSNIKGSDTLYESVKKHGVVNPVGISGSDSTRLTIIDGNHRIAAAHDVNPDMEIPVRYSWYGHRR